MKELVDGRCQSDIVEKFAESSLAKKDPIVWRDSACPGPILGPGKLVLVRSRG